MVSIDINFAGYLVMVAIEGIWIARGAALGVRNSDSEFSEKSPFISDYRTSEPIGNYNFYIRKRKSQSTANMNNIDGVIDETKPLR